MRMSDKTRRVLLVGSLPYDDEAAAMARAFELAGHRLIALPDGRGRPVRSKSGSA